jgi:replicative DNA helicase
MARTAKNVAKEMGVPVIALSQLNRSALHPSLKMLRGSGQIEESADNVVLIDRPEAYPDNKVTKYEGDFANSSIKDTAKLILAKGRGVGTWSTLVGFEAQYTRFFDFYQAKAGEYQEQSNALPF